MLGRQIFKSHFGKHYKIHFIKDGPVPRSLKPERFSSSHSARQFLRELRVPESYWQQLASRCDNAPSFRGHQRDHLQAVSHNITSGRIRIYEVDVPDSDALAKSAIAVQDRQGYQYQFATMKQALAFPGRTPQRFSSAQQVYETLYDLAPNLEQLQALATDLQLTPAAEQQTYTQLVDALAEGLAQQHIALYVTAPFKRPEPVGAALEASTNMPGNRKVDLAPATPAGRVEAKVIENKIPIRVEGEDFFKEVEIVDAKGKPVGEFDEIDLQNGIFFEDKSAKGLSRVNPRTGLPAQTPQEFADKQILLKTRNRINNLQNSAVATRATTNGTQTVPSLDQIQNVRRFEFRLDGDTPELRSAVGNSLERLKTEFPDFNFNATFGGTR